MKSTKEIQDILTSNVLSLTKDVQKVTMEIVDIKNQKVRSGGHLNSEYLKVFFIGI